MFIVLIGPAALNIMHNLGGLFDWERAAAQEPF